MNWIDKGSAVELYPPAEFSFSECLVFLGRSEQESLHTIRNNNVYKLLKLNEELVLLEIGGDSRSITIQFPHHAPDSNAREEAAKYVWEWFDLDQDLTGFYAMSAQDPVLRTVASRYYGLRMVGIPDLFEALIWAIIGQQINLTFAYTLKRRFVELYGETFETDGITYRLFPDYERIAAIAPDELREYQFSVRKAEYMIGVAKAMADGDLSKERLIRLGDREQVHRALTSMRGIGAWTADYAMMKCLHDAAAFPIADVGLHNALKAQLGLERKPAIAEIKVIAENWGSWKAYATFYLWRSLYE